MTDYNARIDAEFKPKGATAVRTSGGLKWRFRADTPTGARKLWSKIERRRKEIDSDYNGQAREDGAVLTYRRAIYDLYRSLQSSRAASAKP